MRIKCLTVSERCVHMRQTKIIRSSFQIHDCLLSDYSFLLSSSFVEYLQESSNSKKTFRKKNRQITINQLSERKKKKKKTSNL